MSITQINGKTLLDLGYPKGPVFKMLLNIVNTNFHNRSLEDVSMLLKQLLIDPAAFTEDSYLSAPAKALLAPKKSDVIELQSPVPFSIFGESNIDVNAIRQMNNAVRLPVTVAGALMADAHPGYGLPIGGVLATDNAVIPYGVGVDIGCRMCLSVLDLPVSSLENKESYLKALQKDTVFGAGATLSKKADHAIIERKEFKELNLLKQLYDKAVGQLGTSGSGNHFVEWGIITVTDQEPEWGLAPGEYVALLSHSGSRGLGAQIAGHYTKLAKELCHLPEGFQHLAWLDLNTQEGQEYWTAMTLAGDYAAACHHVIHEKLIKTMGATLLRRVENHHNFAWKEVHNGQELIVHRKGATPAGKGVLGIIPGSMTAPGFVVRGTGVTAGLQSASHGAGRVLSRSAAKAKIKPEEMKQILADHGVTLIGGGLDEAPGAYKDINTVMKAQTELVEVLGEFKPKYVRMADGGPAED
ncbi:RtcB family protein [Chitinophaga silvatica]|uniref:3'-phosphate/5'-hydroxy nucleic acid ligase n=1 Tax=Chitinophaga silvatica TaxID=2282649 RepID=A0A3E1YCH0_9BACT|nr:RtcB family protein [Chitinophaga silvatica]RFS23958.1 RtcB family protein [Chitinophaga silvatica]